MGGPEHRRYAVGFVDDQPRQREEPRTEMEIHDARRRVCDAGRRRRRGVLPRLGWLHVRAAGLQRRRRVVEHRLQSTRRRGPSTSQRATTTRCRTAKECQQNGGSPAECLDPANYTDAIMALDMDTGAVRWSTGVQGFDDWNVACIPGLPNPNACPQHPGPDFDFGLGPNLFTVNIGTDKRKV